MIDDCDAAIDYWSADLFHSVQYAVSSTLVFSASVGLGYLGSSKPATITVYCITADFFVTEPSETCRLSLLFSIDGL